MDASLLITSIDEVGELPFKSPPPISRETLSRDGLVRKLRGIQKRAGSLEDYYLRFNEVSLTAKLWTCTVYTDPLSFVFSTVCNQ